MGDYHRLGPRVDDQVWAHHLRRNVDYTPHVVNLLGAWVVVGSFGRYHSSHRDLARVRSGGMVGWARWGGGGRMGWLGWDSCAGAGLDWVG